MDSREKIAWLKRYRQESQEIDRLTEEVQRWASRATKVTASISHTPGAKNSDPMGNAVDAMVDIQSDMVRLIEKSEGIKAEVAAVIDAVDDVRFRQLLRYRYLSCYSWERVAVEMDYSYDRVRHLHTTAVGLVKVDTN